MLLLRASKLDLLPKSHPPSSYPSPSSSSSSISSLLFEPHSRSLALMLSDSSFLLYPSFSPSPSPSPPRPSATVVPPISTAACFLRLLSNPSSDPGHILFVSASPHAAGSGILLRAWILLRRPASADLFAPARLTFRRDHAKSAVALDLPHGFSVRLAGSVNVLVLHSLAANKIWVLTGRKVGQDGDGQTEVVLNKCAVIDCVLPIYSVVVSMGFLLLGEVDGARVFPLRPLVKGRRLEKHRGLEMRRTTGAQAPDLAAASLKKSLPNGLTNHAKIGTFSSSSSASSCVGIICCNGNKDSGTESGTWKIDDAEDAPLCKFQTVKLRQDSGDFGSFFVFIRCMKDHSSESDTKALKSLKAVSVRALNKKKFLILDSEGYLHLIDLHNTVASSETNVKFNINSKDAYVTRFDHTMKVQMLAVLPDLSTRKQVVWLSDGRYSVHMMSVGDPEYPISVNNEDENKEKTMQMTVTQAIFTGEKIQKIVPLAADSILILCQGNIFVYAVL
ncbi:hypothetical protein J5N97_019480 [Dioscorea zingiberensis]|uniref:Uncharacterized protein n=1 Tax=Dioscorea zingiberensis TaxID=325984 RepID=A0A9D5HCB9_9LILI|nr:hypothetical protein J5N97_019480 [Dioscorea zingiberensis]